MENLRAAEWQLRQAESAMSGLAIGDALGMQYEILTHEQIMEITNGEGVKSFDSPGPRPDQRPFSEMSALKIGDTTDDTQLATIISKSLIENGSFDLQDVAKRHVDAMNQSSIGWGSTTKKSVKELEEYFLTSGNSGRRWDEKASNLNIKGTGNGIAMKVAPLVLFYLYQSNGKLDELGDWVMKLAFMTHRDPRAGHAAYALARTIVLAIHYPYLMDYNSCVLQQGIPPIDVIALNVHELEKRYPAAEGDVLISRQLSKISQLDLLDDVDRLREEIGVSCHSVESVPFAIAVILRNLKDFRAGVLEAINSGGDTDTIAAMVGCVLGILNPQDIPEEWLDFSPEFREIGNLGRKLAEVALETKAD